MSSPVSQRRLRSTGAKGKGQSETESRFARLRRLRATGESAISLLKDDDDDDDDDMYMKVDEDEYQSIIRRNGGGSLHDFVEDDDGAGYADDGTDDIGAESAAAGAGNQTKITATFKQKRNTRTAAARETRDSAAAASERERTIGTMFKNAHLRTPKPKPNAAKARAPDDEAFMASLMDDLDGDAELPTTPTTRSARRRPAPAAATYSAARRASALASASVRSAGGHAHPLTPMPRPVGITDISDPSLDPFAVPPAKKIRYDPMHDPFGPGAPLLPSLAEDEQQKQSDLVDIKPRIHDDDDGDDAMAVDVDMDSIGDGVLEDLDDIAVMDEDVKPVVSGHDSPLYAADAEDDAALGKSWMAVQQEMAATHQHQLKKEDEPRQQLAKQESTLSAVGEGSTDVVHMYWLDALEKNGALYLVGKTRTDNGSEYQSCCVKVSGIERNVFLLPRIDPATDERYPVLAVHRELETLAPRHGVREFACKPVERKYAFEVPGVPASAEYLKVVYGFDKPALPADLSGQTFSHAFGTSYSALELFLLKRRLMGPCWVAVRGARRVVEAQDRLSWCRSEYTVDEPKDVRAMSDDEIDGAHLARVPPLTTLTMSLKTVMNHRDNRNEVVAISMLVHRNASLDDPTPAAKRTNATQLTAIRQLTGIPLPADFARVAQAQSQRGALTIEVAKTETALLNFFTAFMHRTDPDVVAAHNFYGFDLDVLLHRMQELRIDGWSKLGRLRRTQFPRLQTTGSGGGMGESTFGERQIVTGRIICDTYMASKDLIRAKSYALTNLASQELQIKRDEIPFERIPEYYASSKQLLLFVRHTAFDAFLAAALMIHLQALPLTKQLTTLAGNLWSRTLMGARAERNEFLLLHEFYRSKFIRPDRVFGAQRPPQKQAAAAGKKGAPTASLQAEMAQAIDQLEIDEDDDGSGNGNSNGGAAEPGTSAAAGGSGRRKPAYLGGLVLEPKRGLYDRFVLLLDFNSLYPSIIQEFNICFTTVRRNQAGADSDSVPDAPPPDLAQGILPRLLKTLVDRRRQVKRLLKQPGLAAEEAGQLDVRQKALKLTANSMYGCLGFTHSRFYAKPLAMLITARGREILQATRDLALADGLEVVYGDTDSIMIATRSASSLADAYELGAQFKRRVNERYRLLELDIDGVFRRLLLLRKKKYAALLVVDPEKHIRDGSTGGTYATKLESKGLDLVRRDWCDLSHDVSDYVLKQLFADPAASDQTQGDPDHHDESQVIVRIHEYLTRVGNAVRAQQVPLDKYVVHKGLTKAPENYPDKKSQPHVLVALRLRAKGAAVRAGDTVPYVICDAKCPGLDDGAETNGASGSASTSYAARARHPDEIRESAGRLYPDVDWYLNQQVLPPCARLLEPLEGTDMPAQAQCLGLDAARFRASSSGLSSSGAGDTDVLRTLDSQITDAERFKHAEPFVATCQACKKQFQIDGIARRGADTQPSIESGLPCPHCNHLSSPASLATQLALLIRGHIRRYYSFVMACDEPSCALSTRVLSAAGVRCLRPACSGRLRQVYSDKMLYTQIQYFAALLSVDRSAVRLECPAADLRVLRDRHVAHVRALAVVVDSYLAVSARKFVDLGSLFSFCHS